MGGTTKTGTGSKHPLSAAPDPILSGLANLALIRIVFYAPTKHATSGSCYDSGIPTPRGSMATLPGSFAITRRAATGLQHLD
ncbi:hypothetical protein, partial [Candidatus Aalborgicola defluviihabitans]|uniref:hypothetical protein n=1 Tax=Candidatus Aalborgicola defluviihabitans TaxID=3386187 RepID=UPI0039B8E352